MKGSLTRLLIAQRPAVFHGQFKRVGLFCRRDPLIERHPLDGFPVQRPRPHLHLPRHEQATNEHVLRFAATFHENGSLTGLDTSYCEALRELNPVPGTLGFAVLPGHEISAACPSTPQRAAESMS